MSFQNHYLGISAENLKSINQFQFIRNSLSCQGNWDTLAVYKQNLRLCKWKAYHREKVDFQNAISDMNTGSSY